MKINYRNILPAISLLSAGTVILGTVTNVFATMSNKDVELNMYDKSIANKVVIQETYKARNVDKIIEDINKDADEYKTEKEINRLISREMDNPTKNKNAVDTFVSSRKLGDTYDNSLHYPKENVQEVSEQENSNYLINSSVTKALEDDTDSITNKAKEERDRQAIIEANLKANSNKNPDIDMEEYNKARINELNPNDLGVAGNDPNYYINKERERLAQYQDQWAEIDRLYGKDESTAAAMRPGRDDPIQNVQNYSGSSSNINPYNLEPGHILKRSIYNPTGLSAEQFESLLTGTGIEGLGQAFVDMENKWGVDGLFCMSVAFHESAKGTSRLAINNNNLFGMRARSGWKKFNSKYENILYFGEYMNKNLYKGKTTEEIGHIYCPPNTDHWFNCVNKYYQDFLSRLK